MSGPRRPTGRAVRRSIVLLGVVTLVVAASAVLYTPVLRALGRWLVVSDSVTPSDAIVVVAGATPGREREAAELFRRGIATRVILSRPALTGLHAALMRLGIRAHPFQAEARLALEAFGVRGDAIVALTETVRTTEAELRVVQQAAATFGYRRIILVTSADHTRRVRMIWARLPLHDVEAAVHATPFIRFSPDEWWHSRRNFERVLHEYLGIGAIVLGLSGWLE